MVSGALEYLALIFGFNMLLVVVAVPHGLAILTGRKHLVGSRASGLASRSGALGPASHRRESAWLLGGGDRMCAIGVNLDGSSGLFLGRPCDRCARHREGNP
jgi:hypothetical protein